MSVPFLYKSNITVADALTYTDPIGVSIVNDDDEPIAGIITSGWNDHMPDAAPGDFFISDVSGFTVEKVDNEVCKPD